MLSYSRQLSLSEESLRQLEPFQSDSLQSHCLYMFSDWQPDQFQELPEDTLSCLVSGLKEFS